LARGVEVGNFGLVFVCGETVGDQLVGDHVGFHIGDQYVGDQDVGDQVVGDRDGIFIRLEVSPFTGDVVADVGI